MTVLTLKELKAQLPRGKRLIGIDQGSKTWGLAVSTPELTMATPLKTIARTRFQQDVKKLADICAEYGVGGFVIGLPLNMDGSEGPRVDSVRHFALNLEAAKDTLGFMPLIAFFDERLTSFAAEDAMLAYDVTRKKRAAAIDMIAAQHILQGALDTMNN